MIILNHVTRFGNSFNLSFLQEILYRELNISSIFPNGKNFRKTFTGYPDIDSGYVGDKSLEAEMEALGSGAARTLVQLSLENGIDVTDLHKVALKSGNLSDDVAVLDYNDLMIISSDRNNPISPELLSRDKTIILNRAHYLHPDLDISNARKKHTISFREKLQFQPEIAGGISQKILSDSDGCIHIGVHIRRTDYKTYMSGAYFFTDAEYASVLFMIAKHLSNYKTKFVIFSDEDIDLNEYKGLDIYVNGGNMFEDFASMTICDCLIGPPSSFANAASLIGDVPRIVLRDISAVGTMLSNSDSVLKRKCYPNVA